MEPSTTAWRRETLWRSESCTPLSFFCFFSGSFTLVTVSPSFSESGCSKKALIWFSAASNNTSPTFH